MSETMRKEFEGEALKRESNPKTTGAVFLLLAVLVLAIGIMVHYAQTGGLPNDQIVNVLIAQLHIKFATDFFIGFFTGIFGVTGIYYLRQKQEILSQEQRRH